MSCDAPPNATSGPLVMSREHCLGTLSVYLPNLLLDPSTLRTNQFLSIVLSCTHNTMDALRLKPGILIVSDTASRDPSSDKSGAVLTETFSSDGGDKWSAPVVKIVPDSVTEIQRAVQQWTDLEDYCNLIVTTGGTGFAVKDNTPEVRYVLVRDCHASSVRNWVLQLTSLTYRRLVR